MGRRLFGYFICAALLGGAIVGWARFSTPPSSPDIFDTPSLQLAQQLVKLPEPIADGKYPAKETFFLLGQMRGPQAAALEEIAKRWQPGNAVMVIEMGRVRFHGLPGNFVEVLEQQTGKSLGKDSQRWYQYLWQQDDQPHPQYADFKAALYATIDPRFSEYFDDTYPTTIRLDEILWGGVVRDGIPPLKNPRMLAAKQASYLADSDVVFGLEINGDARAYPKRILAWHEMFKDTVGQISINGVYCTLCGSMIVYKTELEGVHYELGTSGFLYRSNKLMYDHATKSMWSTLTGEPVVGKLVGKGIQLQRLHVVTTTWGEWRRRHPTTTVLSLDTGHRRDYGEGVAYREYFATDRLMFRVPFADKRLKNKQEVLALRWDDAAEEQLAIDAGYLQKHPIYHDRLGEQEFVVLTDRSGANRVYDTQDIRFEKWDGDRQAIDQQGGIWKVDEAGLTSEQGKVLSRLPAHRAFWFGWHAAYPETRLVSE
ncbi:MAG: DUF3179 domain-containing protein [Planctomycetes bacterium]|nr:DUF3179 domain-containing protein [Planctomycetota bacterium]